MPTLIKWQTDTTTKVTVFAGAADAADDMVAKPTAKAALSAAIENTDGSQYAFFELHSQSQAASASGYFNLWIIRSLDGTTFEDGAGSTAGGTSTIPARPADMVIPVRDLSTTQQVVVTPILLLPPQDFKILLQNVTGQTLTTTTTSVPADATTSLFMISFNDEAQ